MMLAAGEKKAAAAFKHSAVDPFSASKFQEKERRSLGFGRAKGGEIERREKRGTGGRGTDIAQPAPGEYFGISDSFCMGP